MAIEEIFLFDEEEMNILKKHVFNNTMKQIKNIFLLKFVSLQQDKKRLPLILQRKKKIFKMLFTIIKSFLFESFFLYKLTQNHIMYQEKIFLFHNLKKWLELMIWNQV
jgi:hypothetical protein